MDNYFDKAAGLWDKDPMKVDRAATTARKIKSLCFHSTNSVVDFGSGTGLLGVHLKDIFDHVHLVDSSSEMLRIADEKIAKANISNISTHCVDKLSKLGTRFSAVTTLMVLHHIDNIKAFFAEAFSALEENGTLIIADLYKEDGSFHKSNASFSGHNGFDTSELSEIAEQAGFSVESVEPYFEIRKENYHKEVVSYPLFLFVAIKQG
ncbi:class I SAM-dependent DNA methyltransferase [Vibrio salinus]|uniref:class I SAM-dependent DNA methyltransferase n=1 Tax=Vibrio salinus TaxID=2899784 RepID=UPI001E340770|nr:class I SAM-dependent methyltransferase [Vibrio salinus]MCE0494423.1 class I SAM-dependent methyltransferase [Vibrio salinus]